MALDGVKNFAKVTVSTGYDAVAVTIVLSAGEGAKLPNPSGDNYNVVWWNSTDYSDPSDDPNVEIVRVTAKSTDTLTVTRAQESTTATTKNTASKTYRMILAITAKMITDIESSLATILPPGGSSGDLQYNNAGSFGGINDSHYDSTYKGIILGSGTNAIARLDTKPYSPSAWLSEIVTALNPTGLFIQGRYAYIVASLDNALEIYDISNQSNIELVSASMTNNQSPYKIAVHGKYAYIISNGANYLEVWNIQDPTVPTFVSQIALVFSGRDIYVKGNYAYIVESDAGTQGRFEVIDIGDPTSMSILDSEVTAGLEPYRIWVQDNYAYIVNINDDTLTIWNIADPTNILSVGSMGTFSAPKDVYVQGRYAYVVDDDRLFVIDVKNPALPTSVGSANLTGATAQSIYLQGRYAYVGESDRVEVFDISNPLAPTIYTSLAQNSINDIFVVGRLVATVDTSSRFGIADFGSLFIAQLETGGIETGTLNVRNNLQATDATFRGGVVAEGSINSQDGITATYGSFLQGNIGAVGIGVDSNSSIARLLIDQASGIGVAHMRLRDASNTRYRSDWNMVGASGFSINSYDSVGAVYLPAEFVSSQFKLYTGTSATLALFATNAQRFGFSQVNPAQQLDIFANVAATPDDTKGIGLRNTTLATTGAQKYSPEILWRGNGWKTNATAASQSVLFRQYLIPIQGTANPTGYLITESSVNAAAYNSPKVWTTDGKLGLNVARPTYDLSFGGDTARTIWMERNTAANAAGYSLTIQSGGASSGGTNKTAGNLYLTTGLGTGNAASAKIYIQAPNLSTTSGTTDQILIDRCVYNNNVALTSGITVTLFQTGVATSNRMSGGHISYTIKATDGVDFIIESGRVAYANINKAGVYTGGTSILGTSVVAKSDGTDTISTSFAISNDNFQVTCTLTGMTATTFRITFNIENNADQTSTPP